MTDDTIETRNVEEKYFNEDVDLLIEGIHEANLSPETIRLYKQSMNPDLSFRTKALLFLAAENEAGQWASVITDFVTFFIPFGKRVNNIRDFIKTRIKQQYTMSEKVKVDNSEKVKVDSSESSGVGHWIVDRLQEPSTWRGVITAATALGVALSPDLKEATITAGVSLFGLVEVLRKEW